MNSKGFTLIEILTVILLIGIMSAVAIPRFEKRIELEELKHEKEFTYTLWQELEVYAKEQKELLDEDGETYTEEDVRLTVYENLHDNLKYHMSDVAYL